MKRNNKFTAVMALMGSTIKKNMLEYVRYPVNMIFSVIMPAIWLLPMYFLAKSFAPDGQSAGLETWVGSTDFFSFFMIGLIVTHVIMSIFWNIGFALKRLMDIGMLETIWSCPIPKVGYIIAESLFNFIKMLWELVLTYLIFRFAFGMVPPPGILKYLHYFLPFAFLMYGFGIGFASLVLLAKDANMLVDTLSFVTTGITGTQNPIQVFPRALITIALAVPITHFLDLLRHKSMGTETVLPPEVELVVFLISAVVFPLAGIVLFKVTDKQVRQRGTLHVH